VEILRLLISKLKSAEHRLRGLQQRRKIAEGITNEKFRVKRWKYVFVKPYLDAVIHDLAKWQRLYEPSWYLIMKIASPVIDVELQKTNPPMQTEAAVVLKTAKKIRRALNTELTKETHVFLSSEGLKGAKEYRIPHTSAVLLDRPNSSSPFIVDSIPCPAGSFVGLTARDIRRLATKLRSVDPDAFGVMKCRGVVKLHDRPSSRLASLEIIFERPSSGDVRSLRSCMIAQTGYSLNDRITLAKQLATSVNYVHTLDFVHKNVRPENVIGFGGNSEGGHGAFFLIGFEQIRSDDGKTYMSGSDAWEKNIYRHPDRQGIFPEEVYNMRHDIYSLGVCLLEIGMWSSFVSYSDDKTVEAPGTALELTLHDVCRKRPAFIKNHLVSLAKGRLPQLMGMIYTDVVVNCLTCLDDDNDDYEELEDTDDANGVLVGVKYIENVCQPFHHWQQNRIHWTADHLIRY
jgi:hypothetical protein